MSNLHVLHNGKREVTADQLRAQGWVVDDVTLEVLAPPEARMVEVCHENLRRVGSTPNPAPTLSPQVQRRGRVDSRDKPYHGGPGGSAA